jgi:hypothetical protein
VSRRNRHERKAPAFAEGEISTTPQTVTVAQPTFDDRQALLNDAAKEGPVAIGMVGVAILETLMPVYVVPPEPGVMPPRANVCNRLIQHDSMAWWCACGATGRVGRSNDGIPFINEEILRHAPGERK